MISRRRFLHGSLATGLVGLDPRVGKLLFSAASSQTGDSGNQVLVVVFLRGGADFLNIVVPAGGPDRPLYEQARSTVGVPVDELLPLGDEPFGLHPIAQGMGSLFDEGRLAVVQGAGILADNRSHFVAQRLMDYGASGDAPTQSGWMARMLRSAPPDPDVLLPAVSLASGSSAAFATSKQSVAVPNLGAFDFPRGFNNWRSAQRSALRRMYEGDDTAVHQAGRQALTASNVLELRDTGNYEPSNGVDYPGNGFGNAMSQVAQLIKLDLGLQAVTVDLGGWDTHANQGAGSGGFFSNLLGTLSNGVHAFVNDLDDRTQSADRTTVVVMSEFGRRIQENGSNGTDHGHGGVMFVAGNRVNGGMHGEWPGLDREVMYDGADLDVTTDYRRVLSDVAIRQFANPALGQIFPGYANHEPMGLVQGDELAPDYTEAVDSSDSAEAADADVIAALPDNNEPTATEEQAAAVDVPAESSDGGGSSWGDLAIGGAVGLGVGAAVTARRNAKRRQETELHELEAKRREHRESKQH